MKRARFALACLTLFVFFANGLALDAPVLSSSSHPDQDAWYNQNLMDFKWDAVDEATGYYYLVNTEPSTVPTVDDDYTEETHASVRPGRDGTYYFHVSAAKGTNMGPASHYKVKLDLTNPEWSTASPLSAELTEDGNIKLTWVEATDSSSGISYYRIHRDRFFDFDFRDAPIKYSPVFASSYLDTNNMTQQMTYFYLIAAVDNAGNQSRISNRATATTPAFCDVNVLLEARLSENREKLVISLSADANLYSATFIMTLPDGKTVEFFGSKEVSDYNAEFDLSETVEGVIKLDLTARERLGDDCSRSKQFIYDITNPSAEIVFPELNETVGEEIKARAKAFDNGDYKSGVDSVEFFVRDEEWESLGIMSPEGNDLYSIDWNTFNFANGRHQLKAVVTDKVGNIAEASSGAIVFNTLYQQGDAEAAISEAANSKQAAIDFVGSLKKQNVLSDSINSIMSSADGNLSKARELYELGGNEYTNARTYAKKAQQLFDSVGDRLALEKTSEQSFVYNQEQVGILLNASPLDRALLQEAEALITAASPQRRIELVKVTDDNSSWYRATVVITFSLSAQYLVENDLNFLNVIEFIPKEFAANASGIYSYYEFSTLKDDPIIEFRVDKDMVSLGEISYGLDKDLTDEEANLLVENNTINKYVVPPILLQASPSMSTLPFSLPSGVIPAEIIFGAVIVVVVVVALLLGLFLYKKRKGSKKPDLSVFQ